MTKLHADDEGWWLELTEWNASLLQSTVESVLAQAAKDPELRQELVSDPHAALNRVAGVSIPEDFQIRFVDPESSHLTFMLPPLKRDAGELTDQQLEHVAGGSKAAAAVDFTRAGVGLASFGAFVATGLADG